MHNYFTVGCKNVVCIKSAKWMFSSDGVVARSQRLIPFANLYLDSSDKNWGYVRRIVLENMLAKGALYDMM